MNPKRNRNGSERNQESWIATQQRADESLLNVGLETLAVDRPFEQPRGVNAVVTECGEEGHGLQWRCGTLAFSLCPRGAQPRSGATLVLVQVSSMKTKRSHAICR